MADLQNIGKELWVISVNFRVLSTFLCVRVISCFLAGSHCVCKGCLSGGGGVALDEAAVFRCESVYFQAGKPRPD